MFSRLYRRRRHHGFAIVEITVASVILVMGSAVLMPVLGQFQVNRTLEVSASDIGQALQRARERAADGKADSAWGVKFSSNDFTVFSGDSYASRNVVFDEVQSIPAHYAISGVDELVYAKLTGLTSASVTIAVTHVPSSKSFTIDVTPATFLVAGAWASSGASSPLASSSSSSGAGAGGGSSASISSPASSSSSATGGGGGGTQGNPYTISTCQHLQNMKNNRAAHYVLVADVDCGVSPFNTGSGFEPISYVTDSSAQTFTGSLDGNDFDIVNLFINRPGASFVGLIGYASAATVKNVTLVNPDINGKQYVGAAIGKSNPGTTVSNVHVVGGSVRGGSDVGGLGGHVDRTTIAGCSSSADILTNAGTTAGRVGGLVGLFMGAGASITDSHATGNVSVWGPQVTGVGGLVGQNQATISRSYATGSVSGYQRVGGLVGYNTSAGSITNSYAAGSVHAAKIAGGLVGNAQGAILNSYAVGAVTSTNTPRGGLMNYLTTPITVTSSYFDSQTTGQSSNGYGTPKTTAQMKQQATFAGWDFASIWTISEGVSYPTLQ